MAAKYEAGQVVKHYKGGIYIVTLTPDDGVLLESTGEPAYIYIPVQKNGDLGPERVVRCQKEFEEEDRFTRWQADVQFEAVTLLSPQAFTRLHEIIAESEVDPKVSSELVRLMKASAQKRKFLIHGSEPT